MQLRSYPARRVNLTTPLHREEVPKDFPNDGASEALHAAIHPMKVCLIKPCVVEGHPGVKPGDVFDTANAYYLIGLGLALEVTEKAVPIAVHFRDPVVENRDEEMQPARPSKPLRARKTSL